MKGSRWAETGQSLLKNKTSDTEKLTELSRDRCSYSRLGMNVFTLYSVRAE